MTITSLINFATRRRSLILRAALLIGICNFAGFAQSPATSVTTPPSKAPLTDDERTELLRLIHSLQERVEKLEAAQASRSPSDSPPAIDPQESPSPAKVDPSTSD